MRHVTPAHFRDPAQTLMSMLNLVQPYVCTEPGNPIRYELDAELAGLLVVLGPDSGWLRISAGGRSDEHLLWDRDCYYDRLGVFLLDPRVDAGASVSIEVLDRPVDRSGSARPISSPASPAATLRIIGLLLRHSGPL